VRAASRDFDNDIDHAGIDIAGGKNFIKISHK
jgi:hypothetical protein